MRRLVLLCGLLSLVGCSEGAITGQLVVGPAQANMAIYAALWSVPSQPSNPSNASSALVATPNGTPTALGTIAVGTSTSGGATFTYTFHELPKGLYFVGAFLDSPSDQNPDINTLVHQVDSGTLLEVDPSSKTEALVTHNIYLATSGPGTGTIRGTVHQGTTAAALPITISALDGPFDANPNVVDQISVDSGAAVPYALFNLPLKDLYIFGDAGYGTATDTLGMGIPSPAVLDATHTEVDGVDVWLGAQSPTLGSISGVLTAQTAVMGASIQILALQGGFDTGAPVVGVLNLTMNGSSANFTLPSIPYGSIYLSSAIDLTINGADLSGSSYYPGPPAAPEAVVLTAMNPNATNVSVPVGVGQIDGTVTLQSPPANVTAVWVTASVNIEVAPGQQQQFIVAANVFPIPSGGGPFAYDLFGLTDGSFNMTIIPTASANEDLESTLNSTSIQTPGTPATVTILGGDRASCDFTVKSYFSGG